MNGMRLKADGILDVPVCEMVYRLEGNQHGAVPMKAKVVMRFYQALEKHRRTHSE